MDKISFALIAGLVFVLIAFFVYAWVNQKSLNKRVVIDETRNQVREYFDNKTAKLKLYYADWCGHCRNFKPIFDGELSNMVLKEGLPCELVKVNADQNEEEVRANNIQGFPTMILEKSNGEKIEYEGSRGPREIVEFLKNTL